MKHALPLYLGVGILFFLRLSNLSLRLSDTNIYFYTAYEILQGKMLYKDIFFTNLPLFPYLSTIYLFISQNNIYFYYFTPTIEISSIALLIYYLVFKQTKNHITALCSAFLYLFSFMTLSTSEHQTGVFLASLFAVSAYLFLQKKKYIYVGIMLGIMLLTKAYFLPILSTFLVVPFVEKRYVISFKIFVSFLLICFLFLLPFFTLSGRELFHDVVSYSLTRSAGVSKIDIVWFFIIKDFFFFLLLLFSLFNYKKEKFFTLCSIFTILFLIFYKDPYYLYFNFISPFLCLSLPNLFLWVEKNTNTQKMILPTSISLFLLYTFAMYISGFRDLGKFSNSSALVQNIQALHPHVLYGVNDTTPALAFLSNTPMMNNIIDTNTNIFRKGYLSAEKLTQEAIKQKAVIVVHGAFYPAYNVNELVLDEIVDQKLLLARCKLATTQPIYTEGIANRINLFSCL